MALVSVGSPVYIVGDGYKLVAVKGAALAISGTVKAVEFGNGTARIWR